MTARAICLLSTLLVMLSACGPSPSEQAVRRWLRCEECNRGELYSVVRFGNKAQDQLIDAIDGPTARERAFVRRQSEDRYTRLHPAAFTLTEYVSHYDSNFVAHYQAQAMVALGLIPTPEARAALRQAMQNDTLYRRDVIRALSRAAPILLTRVTGDSQAAPVDSVVRVDPTVRVTDSVTGQPLTNIRVEFRIDSGGGRMMSDSMQRTGPDGRASVRWALGAAPDSFNVLSARALRRSARFDATAHGATPRVVFLVQPVHGTPAQPLLPVLKVAVVDAWNQRDTTFSGTALASIIGTAIIPAVPMAVAAPVVAGVAEFPNFVPGHAGSGFRIRVTVLGATPAVSQPFDVTP